MSEERQVAVVFPPSDFIREEMEARGWDVDTLAQCSWLKREAVNELLAGSRKVTPVFAYGLAKAFGTSKELWLTLQSSWDARAERKGNE
jgi:HTH-type transcriptional regulator/antitoxin HigA